MDKDCKLEKIGDLDFDFHYGACTNVNNQYIFLCFSDNGQDLKKCRSSNTPLGKYSLEKKSSYPHRWIRIASSNGIMRMIIK